MHRPESREGLLPLPSRVCALLPLCLHHLPPLSAPSRLTPSVPLIQLCGMDLRLVYMTCVCFNPHFLWPSRVTTPGTHTPSCYVSLFISLLRDFDEGSENTSVVIPSWWRPSVKIIALEIVERGTFSFIARVSLINSKGSRESPLAWSGCKFRLHVSAKTGALINARQLSTRVERRYATIRSSTRTSSGRLVIEQSRSLKASEIE